MGQFRPESFGYSAGSNSAGGSGSSVDAAGSAMSGGEQAHLNTLDIHNVHTPALHTEAAHLATAGSHASAAVGNAALAAMPAAGEPVSPLIQLIMRMPGALGVGSSFFEWLTHLFAPGAHDLMPGFEQFGQALHTLADGGDSFIASLSNLATEAPVFHKLGDHLAAMSGIDSSGLTTPSAADHFVPNAENLGGSANPLNAQFEGHTDGALAGPSISNPGGLHYIAGNHRIFGDHLGNPNAGNTMTSATTVPSGNSVPNTVSGATFGQEVSQMPAVQNAVASGPSMGDGAALPMSSGSPPALQTGGGTNFGGNNLIAQDVPAYQPTLGGSSSGLDADAGAGGQVVEPLRAKQLTFSDMHKTAATHHAGSDVLPKAVKTQPAASSNGAVSAGQGMKSVAHSAPAAVRSPHAAASSAGHAPATGGQKVASAEPALVRQSAESVSPESLGNQNIDAAAQNAAVDSSQSTDGVGQTAAMDQPAADYTVERGDSLWKIAEKNLGDGNKWTDIYKLNQDSIGQNPDLIYSGAHLKLPDAGAANIADASHYTVQPGDNLWNIAKSHLGDATKWSDLYKANSSLIGSNPSFITPGQELSLPGSPTLAQAIPAGDPGQMGAVNNLSSVPGPNAGFEQQLGVATGGVEAQAAMPMATDSSLPASSFNAHASVAPTTSQLPMYSLDSQPVPGVSLSSGQGIPVQVSSNGTIQVAPVHDLPAGAGAAGAATLKSGKDAVVSSSLAPDLSFLNQNRQQ